MHNYPTEPTNPASNPANQDIAPHTSLAASQPTLNKRVLYAIIGGFVLVLVIVGIVLALTLGKQSSQQNGPIAPPSTGMSAVDAANSRSRDNQRLRDTNALSVQMEVYFAKYDAYPSLEDVNNPVWREGNRFGSGGGSLTLRDPLGTTDELAAKPAAGVYAYEALPAGCKSVTDSQEKALTNVKPCTSYTITAILETATRGSNIYTKTSIN